MKKTIYVLCLVFAGSYVTTTLSMNALKDAHAEYSVIFWLNPKIAEKQKFDYPRLSADIRIQNPGPQQCSSEEVHAEVKTRLSDGCEILRIVERCDIAKKRRGETYNTFDTLYVEEHFFECLNGNKITTLKIVDREILITISTPSGTTISRRYDYNTETLLKVE